MAWLLFVAIGLLLLSTLYTLMFGGEAAAPAGHRHIAHYVCSARPLVYYLFNNKSVGIIISLDAALETDILFFSSVIYTQTDERFQHATSRSAADRQLHIEMKGLISLQ